MDYEQPGVAEGYRRARALSDATLGQWRDVLRGLVPPAEVGRAADVGCGTGRFTPWLADVFDAAVIGVEPARRMLAQAPAAARVRYVAARAEALPLRAGCLDLVFLSLVYHHVADPAGAAAEFHRALRPGGRVLVRTSTQETLNGYAFMRFFPEAHALDARRLPRRADVRAAFTAAGFVERAHRTVEQRIAGGPAEYCARVRERAISSLQLIPDDAFARGLAALEAHCRTLPDDRVFLDPLDVFVFTS